MDATAIPGAVCPAHPDQPVTFACTRCGSFACARCRQQSGRAYCAACFARLQAEPLTADALLREGFGLLPRLGTRLVPFVLVQLVPALAVGLYAALVLNPQVVAAAVGHRGGLGSLLRAFAPLAGSVGLMTLFTLATSNLALACYVQLFGDEVLGRPRSAGEVFRAGLGRFPATLGANLVRGVLAAVGSLLCCLPGVWIFVMFALAPAAVGLGSGGFGVTMGEAWRLVQKRFWLALGLEAVGWAVIVTVTILSGMVNGALRVAGLGPAGGAVLAAIAGALAVLPLHAINVAFYLRARAQG